MKLTENQIRQTKKPRPQSRAQRIANGIFSAGLHDKSHVGQHEKLRKLSWMTGLRLGR